MRIDDFDKLLRAHGYCWSVGFGGGIREVQARAWKPAHPMQEKCEIVPGRTPTEAMENLARQLELIA